MSDVFQATVNAVPIEIDRTEGAFSFFGLPAVSFWLNPSLYRMMAPLVDEAGVELSRLLIAFESSKGTDEDYHLMVTQLGPSFSEGFLAWGRAVGVAGWGAFEIRELDVTTKRATVRLRNSWELKAQAGMPVRWGCPFIQGKIIGIFSHALGVNCWALEEIVDEKTHTVDFAIFESKQTIASELARLRAAHQLLKQAELAELEQQLQQKQQTILQLSTPVVQLWDRILLLPLIGNIDAARAAQLTENVLDAISTNHAAEVIIDITGVPVVDSAVANSLLKTVHAARLLGTECTLVGISAEVAQTLVHIGTDLTAVRTYSTLEVGLNKALARQGLHVMTRQGEPRPRSS